MAKKKKTHVEERGAVARRRTKIPPSLTQTIGAVAVPGANNTVGDGPGTIVIGGSYTSGASHQEGRGSEWDDQEVMASAWLVDASSQDVPGDQDQNDTRQRSHGRRVIDINDHDLVRREIRQELQAQMQNAQFVTAEAVPTDEEHEPENEPKQCVAGRKCWLIAASIAFASIIAVLVAVLLISLGGMDKNTSRSQGTTSPTVDTHTSEPTDTTIPSPPTPTSDPGIAPTTPPNADTPTPMATTVPTETPTMISTPLPTNEQVSITLMEKMEGEKQLDRFGSHVIVSRDSTTLAVGAQSADYVKVFRRSGNSWSQLGDEINGKDEFGSRLDLAAEGSNLVVGAYQNDDAGNNAGQVRVFQFTDGWNQLGQELNGYKEEDHFGWYTSISDDGLTVAGSARLGDLSGDRVDLGYVRVFIYREGQWEQLGSDLEGEASDKEFGRATALSADGRRLALGSNRWGEDHGRVLVFDFVDGDWNRVGQVLEGDHAGDWQGAAVALSADGSILAIGADGSDMNGQDAGLVRVYKLIGSSWVQYGQDLLGESSGDQFGVGHISLSSDGHMLAVGAQHNGKDRGEAYLFRFNQVLSEWERVAAVSGDNPGDRFGDTVSLSGDASVFAVGSQEGNDTKGYVRVYTVAM